MNETAKLASGWYAQGVTPTPGERYEFEDFVGARWTATLAAWMTIPMDDVDGGSCYGLRLTFDDHEAFETNLPIRFRDASPSSSSSAGTTSK